MKVLRFLFTAILITSSLAAEVDNERFPPPTIKQKASSYTTIGYYIGFEMKDLAGSCRSFYKYTEEDSRLRFCLDLLTPD